jgi:hypothetical protein
MEKFKKGLNVTWKVMLSAVCLIAVAIGVCVLIAFYKDSTQKYFNRRLSNDVEVLSTRNGSEYFVYNQKIGKFTLKNLDWVSSRPDNDSLTVFCKDDKRGYFNVNNGEYGLLVDSTFILPLEYDYIEYAENGVIVVKDGWMKHLYEACFVFGIIVYCVFCAYI